MIDISGNLLMAMQKNGYNSMQAFLYLAGGNEDVRKSIFTADDAESVLQTGSAKSRYTMGPGKRRSKSISATA